MSNRNSRRSGRASGTHRLTYEALENVKLNMPLQSTGWCALQVWPGTASRPSKRRCYVGKADVSY